MARVLVVGSANVDYTVALPRLPQPGETVTDGTLLVDRGGKGANQAVAARRLGAEVRLVACVGDDAAGRDIRAALADEGIAVDGVAVSGAAATGTALIAVDRQGRNQIAVAPGANRALSVEHLRARAGDFAWADVVLASCEVPPDAVRWALEEGRRRGKRTVLNPAPVPAPAVDFWALAELLTPNEIEAARLAGTAVEDEAQAIAAGRALVGRGVSTAIVTLGERGAIAVDSEGVRRVAPFRVEVVDTTGAGDAFNAGLAVGLAERGPLDAALRLASATAALACTRRGAQASLPPRAAVEALLAAASRAR
jgi:ribokinase